MVLLMLALVLAAQDDAAAAEAVSTFDSGLSKTKDPNEKAGLVSTLAQTKHEKVVARLAATLGHEDKTVRAAAAQALGTFVEATPELKKQASKALVAGLSMGINLKDPDARIAILGALGPLQEEAAGAAIKVQLDDKDLKVTLAAMNAAVALRTKAMIEPLIELLKESEKGIKSGANPKITGKRPVSARKNEDAPPDPEEVKRDRAANLIPMIPPALEKLTGQNFSTSLEWQAWWAKNRTSFVIQKKD